MPGWKGGTRRPVAGLHLRDHENAARRRPLGWNVTVVAALAGAGRPTATVEEHEGVIDLNCFAREREIHLDRVRLAKDHVDRVHFEL